MKRRKSRTNAPKIRLVGWEAPVKVAVAVAGLASETALAAPGDLGPSSGQVGRRSDIDSPGVANLWSVDVRADGSVQRPAVESDYQDFWHEPASRSSRDFERIPQRRFADHGPRSRPLRPGSAKSQRRAIRRTWLAWRESPQSRDRPFTRPAQTTTPLPIQGELP